MAASQPRPIVASDPGASPEGLSPAPGGNLKASRDAHILHLTSPSRFIAAFGATDDPRPGRVSGPGRPANAGSAERPGYCTSRLAALLYEPVSGARQGTGRRGWRWGPRAR